MPLTKTISIPKTAVRGRGRSASEITKYKPDVLSQLNAMMQKLDLEELLSVSEYLDRAGHGEQHLTLPDSIARLKAIRILNMQIVSKNRAGVDAASAREAYRNFMNAE